MVNGLSMVLTFEGCYSSNQFIDGDSNGPKIDFLIITSSSKYLRCQVKVSSYDSKHISPLSPLKCFFADSKINYFNSLHDRIVNNILRFNISMTHVSFMKIADSLKDLSKYDSEL